MRNSTVALVLLTVLFYVIGSFPAIESAFCRCLSTDPCWPDTTLWAEFNKSIGGRLIHVHPPAAPCHDPHYDAQACSQIQRSWTSSEWRIAQPGAMHQSQWEMDTTTNSTCLLSSSRETPCLQGSVPVYAVNATSPVHIRLAVKFASDHNLRLVIRNTGHDYLGRSTAAGAFSIWTHHMNKIVFDDAFLLHACPRLLTEATHAVTVGAGVQFEALYQDASEQKRVVVGGYCPTLGAVGGFFQGGGQGPLSPYFGLGADNILEVKVVTADGKILIANQCQNKELFWAIRGGGGGTYGVVVSATHRTHPDFDNLVFARYTFTAADDSSFQRLLTEFVKVNVVLADEGWSGTFLILPDGIEIAYLTSSSMSVAEKRLSPLMNFVKQHSMNVQVTGRLQSFSSFMDWHLHAQCNAQPGCLQGSNDTSSPVNKPSGGGQLYQATRLIPRHVAESSPSQVADVLRKIIQKLKLSFVRGSLVGGRISVPQDNAVNPAWRRSTWLVVIGQFWSSENATLAQQQEYATTVTNASKILIDLTPGSASYPNEADFYEPNWQQSFYGEHYHQLLSIKHKVDPQGLFVCHHCVGSEEWTADLNCKNNI